jgi:hypothetical protein
MFKPNLSRPGVNSWEMEEAYYKRLLKSFQSIIDKQIQEDVVRALLDLKNLTYSNNVKAIEIERNLRVIEELEGTIKRIKEYTLLEPGTYFTTADPDFHRGIENIFTCNRIIQIKKA